MNIVDPHRFEVHQDGTWSEVNYQKIKNGDRFRMFDKDGNPFVYEHEEEVEYIANSDPYFDEELGTWFINIK